MTGRGVARPARHLRAGGVRACCGARCRSSPRWRASRWPAAASWRSCPTSSSPARRAVFGVPETTLGIFPGIGGTQLLPRILGAPLAKELIFTGRRMKADEAKAAGLINHLVPAGQARSQGGRDRGDDRRATARSPCARRRRPSPTAARRISRPAMILAIEAYNATVVTEDRRRGRARVQREAETRDSRGRVDDGVASISHLTDEQRALRAGVTGDLQAVPGRVLARPRRAARVPEKFVTELTEAGYLGRADPAGVRRRRARHPRGRA